MADPFRRKSLEFRLSALLRTAEETTFKDPKVRAMVDQLRHAYEDDQEGVMFMLGMSQTAPKAAPVSLPHTKIPQLLMILDALATKKPVSRPPSRKEFIRNETPSLLTTVVSKPKQPTVTPLPEPKVPRPERPAVVNQTLLEEVKAELEAARSLLQATKQDETLIKSRKGKYAISLERLRAERILREYPEKISHLQHKIILVEDGILR